MTRSINGKNLVFLISVIAWGAAIFFSAKLASADPKTMNQDPTAGWFETEDALPQKWENHSKVMTKNIQAESQKNNFANLSIYSWYETEDALPKIMPANSKTMTKNAQAESQKNNFANLSIYSWYETEDALPQS